MGRGRRTKLNKQQISEDFCSFEDRSVSSWHLQNSQGKMHFKCHYKTDTLSLVISIVGTMKAFRLEVLFIMFHIKIIANAIIQTNSKMLDFLTGNPLNIEKWLQLSFLDRSQSTVLHLLQTRAISSSRECTLNNTRISCINFISKWIT